MFLMLIFKIAINASIINKTNVEKSLLIIISNYAGITSDELSVILIMPFKSLLLLCFNFIQTIIRKPKNYIIFII